MTIDEASEFWDTHSVADVPSREVEIEYAPTGPSRKKTGWIRTDSTDSDRGRVRSKRACRGPGVG